MAHPKDSLPVMSASTPVKTMSSRLLTMKFMQRGAAAAAEAASSPASSQLTPKFSAKNASAAVEINEGEHSAKRRKTLSGTPSWRKGDAPELPNSVGSSSAGATVHDYHAFQSALEGEERKRQVAIERRAAELGDAHWVLNEGDLAARLAATERNKAPAERPALKVIHVGYAQIDQSRGRSASAGDDHLSLDGEDEMNAGIPQKTGGIFFRFNMKDPAGAKVRAKEGSASEGSDEHSDSCDHSSSGSDDDASCSDPEAAILKLIASERRKSQREKSVKYKDSQRQTSSANISTDSSNHISDDSTGKRKRDAFTPRQGAKKETCKKANERASKRHMKEFKGSRLVSISSGGGIFSTCGSGGFRQGNAMRCHRCGKPGHKMAECPKPR